MGAAVDLHVLDASVDVLWHRVERRGFEQHFGSRALTREDLEAYAGLFERPDAAELALYDAALVTLSRTWG